MKTLPAAIWKKSSASVLLRNFSSWTILFLLLGFQSQLYSQKHVRVRHHPITDTVEVYHFIVSGNKAKGADTATTNSFIRESKRAYAWISQEAKKNGVPLYFKEHWPVNRDSNLRNTFAFRLPSTNLVELEGAKEMRVVTQKRTKDHPQKVENVYWTKVLFDSIAAHVKDSATAVQIRTNANSMQEKKIFIIHVLKARESKINGFYLSGRGIFIGKNRSKTIAHESIHYLGAPDLYIHKFWFGKKRRTVKVKLWDEVMNDGIPATDNCTLYTISEYTAYTLGWTSTLDKKYTPLLKQNFMARLLFNIWLKL